MRPLNEFAFYDDEDERVRFANPNEALAFLREGDTHTNRFATTEEALNFLRKEDAPELRQGTPDTFWDKVSSGLRDLYRYKPEGQMAPADIADAQIRMEARQAEPVKETTDEGKDYYRPRFKEEYMRDLYPEGEFERAGQRYAKGIVKGAVSTLEGMAGSIEWLTDGVMGRDLANNARMWAEELSPEEIGFTDELAAGFGSMATFMLPGIGVMKGASALAKTAPRAALWLGASTAATMEAMTEAGTVYREAFNRTQNPEEAERAASYTFWLNLPLIVISNKLGVFGEQGEIVRRAIFSALTEGSQEVGQAIISALALGDEVKLKDLITPFAVGTITGGTFGALAAPTIRNVLKPVDMPPRLPDKPDTPPTKEQADKPAKGPLTEINEIIAKGEEAKQEYIEKETLRRLKEKEQPPDVEPSGVAPPITGQETIMAPQPPPEGKLIFSTTPPTPIIQELLDDPEYQRKKKNREVELKWMTPDEYLQLQADVKGVNPTQDIDGADQNMIERYAASMNKIARGEAEKLFPALWVDKETGNQEGKHRALAAKKIGIQSLPVFIITPTQKTTGTTKAEEIKKPPPVITETEASPKTEVKTKQETEVEVETQTKKEGITGAEQYTRTTPAKGTPERAALEKEHAEATAEEERLYKEIKGFPLVKSTKKPKKQQEAKYKELKEKLNEAQDRKDYALKVFHRALLEDALESPRDEIQKTAVELYFISRHPHPNRQSADLAGEKWSALVSLCEDAARKHGIQEEHVKEVGRSLAMAIGATPLDGYYETGAFMARQREQIELDKQYKAEQAKKQEKEDKRRAEREAERKEKQEAQEKEKKSKMEVFNTLPTTPRSLPKKIYTSVGELTKEVERALGREITEDEVGFTWEMVKKPVFRYFSYRTAAESIGIDLLDLIRTSTVFHIQNRKGISDVLNDLGVVRTEPEAETKIAKLAPYKTMMMFTATNNGTNPLNLTGFLNDNGDLVATNGHLLFVYYGAGENLDNDKIYRFEGTNAVTTLPSEKDDYPNWRKVVPERDQNKEFKITQRTATRVIGIIRATAARNHKKDMFVQMGERFYNCEYLADILEGLLQAGAVTIHVGQGVSVKKPTILTGYDGKDKITATGAVMPLNADSNDLIKTLDVTKDVGLAKEAPPTVETETPKATSEAPPKEQKDVKAKKTRQKKETTGDTGVELAANRRGRATTGLTWEDIANENLSAQVQQTTKQNVFPKPDYQTLIDGGMNPVAAYLIKGIYDSIKPKPVVDGRPLTETDLQQYINGVRHVMTSTIEWMGNIKDVRNAHNVAPGLLDVVYPDRLDAATNAQLSLIGGRKLVSLLRITKRDIGDAIEKVNAGWPAKRESWEIQGFTIENKNDVAKIVKSDGKYYIAVNLRIQRTNAYDDHASAAAALEEMKPYFAINKKNQIVGDFATPEDAREHLKEITKRGKTEGGVSEKGINVAMASRSGVEYRAHGEDVSSDTLRETFGFKGINFGNWLQGDANKAERQLHINHAYDSFMDLAKILNVPPKAISLEGMLGLAIGAQGRGGGAAAHFVPGVNEINLTRVAGAGSLAHEYAHALDHYFALQAGLAGAPKPFLSTNSDKSKHTGEIRGEIIEAFRRIVTAMEKRPTTEEEIKEEREERKQSAIKGIKAWVAILRIEFVKNEVQDAAFDRIAERIEALDFGDGLVSVGGKERISPAVGELVELYKKATGRTYPHGSYRGLQNHIDRYLTIKAAEAAAITHFPQVTTSYARAAKALDEGKSKAYWSSRVEMFARAFDSFISDVLEAETTHNSYLSHTGRSGPTVPHGEERAVINEAFRNLFSEIRTKTTEKGVAIFSRKDADIKAEADKPLSKDELEQYARELVGDAPNQPKLVVVEKASELPFDAPDDARGAFHDGTMYLVVENVTRPEDAKEVVFHEFVGHFGLRGFFGDKLNYVLDLIHNRNPLVRQYTNEWMKNNRDIQAKHGLSALEYHYRAIEEAIARMAQENKPFTIAKRLLSTVQTLLRQIGMNGLADKIEAKSNAEALTILHKAKLYIEKGKTAAGKIPEPLYPYFMQANQGAKQGAMGMQQLSAAATNLLRKIKPKTTRNVRVEGDTKSVMGLIQALIGSPSKIGGHIRYYVVHGKNAVLKQERLRGLIHDKMEEIFKPLNTKELRKEFDELLWLGDMEERNYTREELSNMGVSDIVTEVYLKQRVFHKQIFRLLRMHRASFGYDVEGMKGIEGHVPHMFENWNVYEAYLNEEGEMERGSIVGTFRSKNEAIAFSNSLNPQQEYIIAPKVFRMPDELMGKTVIKDASYFKMVERVEETFKLTRTEAVELVRDVTRRKNRHRFFGHLRERKGQTGFRQKDVQSILEQYYYGVARYVAMDDFKARVVPRFERDFGVELGRASQALHNRVVAEYVEEYINDLNGVPGRLEAVIDEAIKKAFGGRVRSQRPFIWTVNKLLHFTAVCKLGLFNLSAGMVNLTQLLHTFSQIPVKDFAWAFGKVIGKHVGTLTPGEQRLLHRIGVGFDLGLADIGGYSMIHKGGKVVRASMVFFQKAEYLNRAITALAAHRHATTGLRLSKLQARRYARLIVDKTQFDYSVADTGAVFRNPTGRLLGQFKPFAIKHVEFVLGLKGAQHIKFWIPYLLLASYLAIPMIEGLLNFIEWLTRRNPITETRAFLMTWAAGDPEKKKVARMLMYGLPSLVGVDLTRRVGTGDMLPRHVGDLLGPTLNTLLNTKQLVERGDVSEIVKNIAPSVGKFIQGIETIMNDMDVTDPYHRDRLRYTATPLDVSLTMTGLRPVRESEIADVERIRQYRTKKYNRAERKHVDQMVEAVYAGDSEKFTSVLVNAAESGIIIDDKAIEREIIQKAIPLEVRTLLKTRIPLQVEQLDLIEYLDTKNKR